VQTPALIGEGFLHPGPPIDLGLDLRGATRQGPGIGKQRRHIDPTDFHQQGSDRVGDGRRRHPVSVNRFHAGEIVHNLHPGIKARRALQSYRRWCRIEGDKLGQLAIGGKVRCPGPVAHQEGMAFEMRL